MKYILVVLIGLLLGFAATHLRPKTVKPETVVDEWSRLPTPEELANAGFDMEFSPTYKPLMKDGLTATALHLQCPIGYKLQFPGNNWDEAVCVKTR